MKTRTKNQPIRPLLAGFLCLLFTSGLLELSEVPFRAQALAAPKGGTAKARPHKPKKSRSAPPLVGGRELRYVIDQCVYGGVGLVAQERPVSPASPQSSTKGNPAEGNLHPEQRPLETPQPQTTLWIPERLLPGRCQEGRELVLRAWRGWSPRVDPLEGMRVRGTVERLRESQAECTLKGQTVELPRPLLPPRAADGLRFTLVSRWGQTLEDFALSRAAAATLQERLLVPTIGQAQLQWVVEQAGPGAVP